MDFPLLPEHPVPPPSRAGGLTWVHRNDDMADAAGLALREARVALWRDLWRKVEEVEAVVAERTAHLEAEIVRLRKNLERNKARQRRRQRA